MIGHSLNQIFKMEVSFMRSKKNFKSNLLIFVILIAVLMSSLCACTEEKTNDITNKTTEYVEAQDYQFQYAAKDYFSSGNKINETDKGYYFIDDGFIYFMDKSNMEYTPLCNKPDCRHDKSESCNAYLNSFSSDMNSNIFFNKGFIYYPATSSKGGKSIMRISALRLILDTLSKTIVSPDLTIFKSCSKTFLPSVFVPV